MPMNTTWPNLKYAFNWISLFIFLFQKEKRDLASVQEQYRQDEAYKEQNCRVCPHCGRVVSRKC